jgi:nitroreductase
VYISAQRGGLVERLLELMVSRKSVRRWKPDPILDQDIRDILEAAMNAPSAVNEQAWQFILLDGEVLEEFLRINANTPAGAPVGILVCGDKRLDKLEGFYVQDCCAATENILLAVHAKGLGGVWTAVFPSAVPAVCQMLNLPGEVVPISFVPIGYPDAPQRKHGSRYDETKVHRNGW